MNKEERRQIEVCVNVISYAEWDTEHADALRMMSTTK